MRIALEKTVQRFVRKLGFEVRRAAPNTLYQPQPNGYSTFAPWVAMDDRYARSSSTKDHLYFLLCFVSHCQSLTGDMAEFGVYRGGSARAILDTTTKGRLHLFDTFAGMPDEADSDPSPHKKGDFEETSVEAVREFVGSDRAVFHPGIVPDTLEGFDSPLTFVHLDLDLYAATLATLKCGYPLVVSGGIFLFDDYGLPAYVDAEKAATDEFFADKAESPIVLPSGQAFVIKQ